MLPSSAMHGVYDPDTLKAMGAAFDTAVQSIPPHLQDHERGAEETRVAHRSTHGIRRA
jgi:hypothetical protein